MVSPGVARPDQGSMLVQFLVSSLSRKRLTMKSRNRAILGGPLLAVAMLFAPSAFAQMEVKIIAPAAPGGGWDQTARTIQQTLVAEKLGKSAQEINVAGAG